MKKLAIAALSTLMVLPIALSGGSGQAQDLTGLSNVPAEYQDVLLRAGSVCDAITPAVLAAQVEQESGWDPNAVSPAGAQGISQFMPGTWASNGLDGDGDGTADVFNPIDAIWSQGNHMCDLAAAVQQRIDSGALSGSVLELTLAAYNAGLGNVDKYGGVPPFTETRNYVKNIVANAATYQGSTLNTNGNTIVAQAQTYLGVPYVWGGESLAEGGLDCSGLIWRVYQDLGTTLPIRTADQMANWSKATVVPCDQMQPGDLVAFKYQGAGTFHHIGIYAGVQDGQRLMIHAPRPGTTVELTPLDVAHRQAQIWKCVRF